MSANMYSSICAAEKSRAARFDLDADNIDDSIALKFALVLAR